MNKTWKTILKILGYVISFLLTKDKGQKTKKSLSGGQHRGRGCRTALLCRAVVPPGRLHLRARPVHQNH